MKTTYKYFIYAALFLVTAARAQVSLYSFNQFSGTYNAITGGTVLGSTTSDDQVFVDPANLTGVGSGATGPGFPIGFNFTYNFQVYDRIGVSNNGWIFFGQSAFGNSGVNSNT